MRVARSGSLADVVARERNVPVPLGSIALLNNLQDGDTLAIGFQLKIVRGTFQPQSATR